MEFPVLMEKMVIFVILMLIAYIMARRGILGPEFIRASSKLVIDVFMVGTILSSMISSGAERGLSNFGQVILLTFLVQLLGYVVAAIAIRYINLEENRKAPFEILMAVGNTMFIALPIADALYGSYAVMIISLSCIAFNILLYSYGIWKLKGKGGSSFRVRDMISIPLIATLLGILIIVIGIPVPGVLKSLFSALGGATMPMSMMVIGASLGTVSLLDAFRNPKFAILSAVRLILVPVLSWLICRLITDDTVLLMTCMIIAAAPSAVIITILSIQYGRDGVFCSEGVLHSTVCSMVTIPILISVFSHFC